MFISALLASAIYSGNQGVVELLKEAPAHASRIIEGSLGTVRTLVEGKTFDNIFILGSGPLYAMAREGALKCMEMSITDAFSYPFLESRHGPRSLIDERTLVVGLYSHGGQNYEARLMEELTLNHRATTMAVVPRSGWKTGVVSATLDVNCDWPDSLVGLAYLPVLQLTAYYLALAKGLNPDQARFHSAYVEIKR
jgi:glucosamine--fructose-6-phosphate aminotransferase (isomerizing)